MKKNLSIFFVVLIIGIINIFIVSCNNGAKNSQTSENDTIDSTINIIKIDYPKNPNCDKIGNLLAGIDNTELKDVLISDSTTANFWKSYCDTIGNSWKELANDRLSKMDKWAEKEISPKIEDSCLLFYPFSGPDFLNAFHLFPNANNYIFIAMEKLGTLPDLQTMPAGKMKTYLEAVHFSIRDIYKRSYFITGNMEQDLRKKGVDGVLPVLYLFLMRTGHEIYDFGYYQLQDDGVSFLSIEKPTNSLKVSECIKFKILKKGDNKLKEFTYFYADISDDGFVKNPTLLQYLKNMSQCNTFIKSASYLSHYETFTNIRNIVLDKSKAVLQDDTGVPFRYFATNFEHFLYGVYEAPIDDFKSGSKYLTQKDLKDAYDTENPKALDFSLGYHWRHGKQNWALYVRK